MNVFLDVNGDGGLRYVYPEREPEEMPARYSCALDIADRGGLGRLELAELLRVSPERTRQIIDGALLKLRSVPGLEVLAEEFEVRAPNEGDEMAERRIAGFEYRENGCEGCARGIYVPVGAPLDGQFCHDCSHAKGREKKMAKREKVETVEEIRQAGAAFDAAIQDAIESAPRNEPPPAPREEGVRSFSVVLAQCEDGALHAELSAKLQQLAATMFRHADSFGTAKGTLGLTLTFTMDQRGTTTIASEIKVKEPKAGRPKSVFWLTKANNLINENPRQTKLPLHEVPSSRGAAREV